MSLPNPASERRIPPASTPAPWIASTPRIIRRTTTAAPHSRTFPQLYIDPVECIDCGACVPVCPVSAIFALEDLPEKWKQYTELNESYVKASKFTPEEFAKHQSK